MPTPTKSPKSIRPSEDIRARIAVIAKANGIKPAVVYQLALAGGLAIVETKLAEIRDNRETSASVSDHQKATTEGAAQK